MDKATTAGLDPETWIEILTGRPTNLDSLVALEGEVRRLRTRVLNVSMVCDSALWRIDVEQAATPGMTKDDVLVYVMRTLDLLLDMLSPVLGVRRERPSQAMRRAADLVAWQEEAGRPLPLPLDVIVMCEMLGYAVDLETGAITE